MAQVKFYSVGSLPNNPDPGGVYFVNGGELYKGASRFGANKVFTAVSNAETLAAATAGISGQIGGDILVGFGAAKVWDASANAGSGSWVDLGQDQAALDEQLAALVSGLAFASDAGSYITGITQDRTTGEVTAQLSNFANDVKAAIGDSSVSGAGNGITVSVATTSGSVTSVQVSAADLTVDTITAATGNFTNLNVTSTATFSATTVSADTLTIGGSTVEQLADKQIAAIAAATQTSTSNGITVGVTTQSGSVTAVSVDATAFGNVMSFKGVVPELPSESNVSGDIVVIGANPSGAGLVQGQEYIYDGTNWELIGDQNTYAVNAYSSTASVYTGATTVPAALNAAGAAIDALNTKTGAYVGGSASDADQGVSVTVSVDATTLAPSVDVVVTSATLFGGLDADVSSSENNSIQVGVTQVDGVVTGVTADLVWLDANGDAIA